MLLSDKSELFKKNYVKELNDYEIKEKEVIEINLNNTFGIEIEFANALLEKVKKEINNLNNNYDCKEEHFTKTNNKGTFGGEVATAVLKDKKKDWLELRNVLEILKNNNASLDHHCGIHIHVGNQVFNNPDTLIKFLYFWAIYEPEIFIFANGEYTHHRKFYNNKDFAEPVASYLKEGLPNIKTSDTFKYLIGDMSSNYYIKKIFYKKLVAFNMSYTFSTEYIKYNTTEFRVFNPTLDLNIIQNYTNFIFKMVDNLNNVDLNYLKELLSEEDTSFNKIFQMVDLVYTKDSDKNDCLKQIFYKTKKFEKN